MHIGPARLEHVGPDVRVVCSVTVADETRDWWVEVGEEHTDVVDVGPTAILPAALLIAATRGEDVSVDDPLDPVQMNSAARGVATMSRWWGWRTPVLHAASRPPANSRGDGAGLFMSRGVDSLSTLVAAMESRIAQFTHLLWIDRISPFTTRETDLRVWADTVALGEQVGTPVVRIATNLQDETERCVPWIRAFGAVTIGAGLVLGPRFRRLVLAPGVATGDPTPLGNHAEVDPLWSTSATDVEFTDPYRDRMGRVEALVRHPDVARHLRVCWEEDVVGNCGRCHKCVLTMSSLQSYGATGIAESAFGRRATPELVRAVQPTVSYLVYDLVDRLVRITAETPQGDELADLRDAWIDHSAASTASGQRGAAGFDLRRRHRAHGLPRPSDEVLGWGPGASAIDPTLVDPALVEPALTTPAARVSPVDRPLAWTLLTSRTHSSVLLADLLARSWGPGACVLVDDDWPELGATGAHRLLRSTRVRLWWSEETWLDGPAVVETVEAGAVPLQVVRADDADTVRAGLPPDAAVLVLGDDELDGGPPDQARLTRLWAAATRLVTGVAPESVAGPVPS